MVSVSRVLHAQSADGGTSSATPAPEGYPVPPDWIIADPEENRLHVLAMIEQGERAIAAGCTTDGAEVQHRMRELIAARKSSSTPEPESFPVPPDWIIADPEENRQRILAMLEQGDRDIAAGRGYDADDVLAEADEIIDAAMRSSSTPR
jgi:predicted transcriptional regulator